MAEQIVNGASVEDTLAENIDLELTEEEVASVKTAAETGDQTKIDDAIEKSLISAPALVGRLAATQVMTFLYTHSVQKRTLCRTNR